MATNDGKANQGWTYEKRMCMLLFIHGYTKFLENFQLRYQVQEAGKIDDVVFYDGEYLLIQLKHTTIEESKMTHSDLFHREYNGDFNLIKYVKSVNDANKQEKFKDKIKAVIVFTNYKLDLIEESGDEINLIDNKKQSTAQNWYKKLDPKPNSIKLTPISLDPTDILYLSDEVPDAKYYKFTDDPNIVKILQKQAKDSKTDHSEKVGAITEDEIRKALDKIIYAVEQPNSQLLQEIIKKEIKENLKLHNAIPIYNSLELQFTNWCENKDPLERSSTRSQTNIQKQYILTYADADKFFKKEAKVMSFGVSLPSDLKKINEKLHKNKIHDLRGDKRTQIAGQFIQKYGKSEFAGRVIWIEAESEEKIKKSFKELKKMLEITVTRNKDTEKIISDLIQHFNGFKVLFVFNNFDDSPESKLAYCRTVANGFKKNKESCAYFLFTVQNVNASVCSVTDAFSRNK